MARNDIVMADGFVGTSVEQGAISGTDDSSDDAKSIQDPSEDFFQIAIESLTTGNTHLANGVRSRWIASIQAYNNRHFSGSKYLSKRYKSRTHLFRPKTRSAVRSMMKTTAAALFSNPDAVTITAGDEQNKEQLASAAIKQELINYRLDRASGRNAIPWFVTAMGAVQSTGITGLVCSKQYWQYSEREIEVTEEYTEETSTPEGLTVFETKERTVTKTVVERDRPYIELFPLEQVGRDPAADWMNQVTGSFLYLTKPITVDDLQHLMKQPGPTKWRDLGAAELKKSVGDYESSAVRQSREEGTDRFDERRRPATGQDLTWIHEMFIRKDGQEYCFWMLGNQQLLSDPILLSEAYPEQHGERPVVIGTGSIDAFTVNPMSLVESWQPLQQEINDVVNLRLDNMKQSVAPVTKIKRSARLNVGAIQNRSADSVLYVNQMDDVEFDRPQGFPAEVYQETDRLSADFDELAGLFSGSSVNSNRQLSETVGGMKLLNQTAMTMGEYDLTVFVETWVEPTMRQVLKLEEYYESDETVLALAANKAQAFQKYGINEITDELLNKDVTCRVNAGRGASDPIESMNRFVSAVDAFIKVTGEQGVMRLNVDEIANEIFSKAGHKDAARFVKSDEEFEDPRLMEAQKMIEDLQAKIEAKTVDNEGKAQIANINAQAKLTEQQMENENKIQLAQMDAQTEMRGKVIDNMMNPPTDGEGRKTSQPKQIPEFLRRISDMTPMPPMAPPPQQGSTDPMAREFMQRQLEMGERSLKLSQATAQALMQLTQQLQVAMQLMMQPKETTLIRDPETDKAIGARQAYAMPEQQVLPPEPEPQQSAPLDSLAQMF